MISNKSDYDNDMNDNSSVISSSSSSSSDDDFLPSKTNPDGTKITEEEREAIIRKKLLENFYGKSHSIIDQNDNEQRKKKQEQKEKNNKNELERDKNKNSTIVPSKVTLTLSDNLDSNEFDSYNHTLKHLRSSNVERLLSVDEKLALEIRTLNSTMQTLVYENYSKFIDATDAVRSIGQSVDSSEDGLKKLNSGMKNMEYLANKLDKALASSREAVAEKVRVKRHLTKLDSLLKLPNTLNVLINDGKYRLACKTHENAAGVLSKHSTGFESLARIECVCKDIISEMYEDLYRKLDYWSSSQQDYYGSNNNTMMASSSSNNLGGNDDIWNVAKPKSIVDIFECGGTISSLSKSIYFTDLSPSKMSEDECQSKTTNSCANFLVNVLKGLQHHDKNDNDDIIPTIVLDGILETCTLYSVTFDNDQKHWLLGDFVSHVFASFLAHVRTSLLELILVQQENNDENNESKNDPIIEISSALSSLLRSVRELASGLALPEVGVDVRIASGLVDQTVEVSESMIRRYVSLRFESLKLICVKDCLSPFLNDVLQQHNTASAEAVVDVVRMATVVLEDIMQLTEQNIETMATAMISSVPVESTMVQIVIVKNSHSYAIWLASTLETLAGCNVLKANDVYVDIVDTLNDNDADDDDSNNNKDHNDNHFDDDDDVDEQHKNRHHHDILDDISEVSYSDETDSALYTELLKLVQNIDNAASSKVARYLILAIAELCRLAQKSIVEKIDRAIAIPFAVEDNNSSYHHHHQATVDKNNTDISDPNNTNNQSSIITKKRFQLAACRVLALYATDQGSDAARLTSCYDLLSKVDNDEDIRHVPTKPRDCICKILQIIKSTSLDFSHVFGGQRQAGPIPTFNDDDEILHQSRQRSHFSLTNLGAKGLKMEVERMFAQKLKIYSQYCDFHRDAVLYSVFLIIFKAFLENIRSSSLTITSYRQIRIDVELLRIFIPHYISDSFYTEKLYTLLQDVLSNADERCMLSNKEYNSHRDAFIGTDEFITNEEQLYASHTVVDPNKKAYHSGIIVKDFLESEKDIFRNLIISDEED